MKLTAATFLVLLLLGTFGGILAYRGLFYGSKAPSSGSLLNLWPSPRPSPDMKGQGIELEIKGDTLRVVVMRIRRPDSVSLHLNLGKKLSSARAKKENECRSLVSGGFYSKEERPIGLFIAGGEVLGKYEQNQLFNGVLSIDKNGEVFITQGPLTAETKFSLQAGPILIKSGIPQTFKLKSDKPARRIVAAQEVSGDLVFIAIFNKESPFQGPNLADLPQALMQIQAKTGILFKDAINLDGGTASAFYSDELVLEELNRVGSYFCIK